MGREKDITGQKFGKLTAVRMAGKAKNRCVTWECICECGAEIIVGGTALRRGHTKSCGCGRANDISGQRYGRLTAKKIIGKSKNGTAIWQCQCDCGNMTEILSTVLKSGETKSCGCLLKERVAETSRRHGMYGTRIYEIWRKMRRRCRCESEKAYKDYGGRGIKVCDEWNDAKTGFLIFYQWAMENGYADDLTIDRIDVNGNYEPNNCRWATVKEQANNRRNNRKVTYEGETKTVSEWADILDVNQCILWHKLKKHNWNLQEVMELQIDLSKS